MTGHFNVVIDIDARPFPFGELICQGRQGRQRRAVERLELGAPGAGQFPEGALVETGEQGADHQVQVEEREEGVMAQPG